MSAFIVARTVFLALFFLLNGALLATSAVHLTSSSSNDPLRPIDAYLLFEGSFTVLFLFAVLMVDIVRRGALTSTVWFELTWLTVSWLMNLAGSAAVTALYPGSLCEAGTPSACPSAQALMGVTWAGTLLVLAQLLSLVGLAIHHSKRHPEIWKTGVRDFQWSNGGGPANSTVLQSTPPSPAFVSRRLAMEPEAAVNPVPHLERVAANWQPPAPVSSNQPIPLTYANAPAVPPTRVPMHYSASAVVSVGVMPGRRPSSKKAQTVPASLYATTVQAALGSTTATAPKRSTTAPSQQPSDEPLPIRDWPRKNPQEPYRKARSHTTTAAPVIPAGAPGPEPSSQGSTTPPRNRSPRRRPPPLDLSAAAPNKLH